MTGCAVSAAEAPSFCPHDVAIFVANGEVDQRVGTRDGSRCGCCGNSCGFTAPGAVCNDCEPVDDPAWCDECEIVGKSRCPEHHGDPDDD